MDEALLKQALEFGKPYTGKGEVASYIPELSKADGRELGICVRTIGGEEYHCGYWQRRFTIQSISKVINLAMALEHYGFDAVFHKTKMEPSGASFNAMSRISDNEDIPFNPLVNCGAIAMLAGLVIVPVVSLFTPKPDRKLVENAFACYEKKTEVAQKTALGKV